MIAGTPTLARRLTGFTLVELLVVISIIAILASFVLGAIFSSQEHAKGTRTERTITVLHNALMEDWEGFRTRRLPVASGSTQVARLAARRQLMRMEMPDRYEDLFFTPSIAEPALRRTYLRKLNTFMAKYNAATGSSLTAAQYADLIEDQHESAECLYLIMTSGPDMDARLQIKGRDTGDVDGDGMPEIVDGWGRPIHFLRWAPGFVSDLQPDADTSTAAIERDPLNDHDQFDPFKLEMGTPPPRPPGIAKNPPPTIGTEAIPAYWGYALVPLIFSAGPDGEYGIYEMPQSGNDPNFGPKNNHPYSHYDNGTSLVWRGEPNTSPEVTHLDNIHNHLLGTR